jgi:chromosome partitioning protein
MEIPEDFQYIYHHTSDKGTALDFIPCSMELSAVDVSLVNAVCRESILKGILSSLKDDYDYIITDCSPSLGMLTINALVAAQAVIIPVTPEYLSAKGLEILLKNILRVKKKINPELEIEGILFTMYKERMRLTQTVESIVNQTYGEAVSIYETKIPYSIKVGESNLQSTSIIQYAAGNKVSLAYQLLAKEVVMNE